MQTNWNARKSSTHLCVKWKSETDGTGCKTLSNHFSNRLREIYPSHMELLQEEMKPQFSYVDEHVAKCTWIMNPITAKEDVKYLEAEDRLLDVKTNSLLNGIFTKHGSGTILKNF